METLGNKCESQCAEEEGVDPRIQGELERLNQSTDDINRWESELEDFRQRFRLVLAEATLKLDDVMKKIGRAVEESKPYWEARKVARQAQIEAQQSSQEFQRAVEILRAAKETIALAEERLLEEDTRQFDSAWQEMLNHATQRVMEAEQARTRSEAEHRKTAANYNACIGHMKQLEKKLKRSISKSRPYFELKSKYYLQLEQLKRHVDERQAKLVAAKAEYRMALHSLESISEEIHAQRRSLAMGTREQGVGAEGADGNEDISNFKMDSDGLSMVSVSMEEEYSHSSEEEADSYSSSSRQTPPSSPSSSSRCRPSTSDGHVCVSVVSVSMEEEYSHSPEEEADSYSSSSRQTPPSSPSSSSRCRPSTSASTPLSHIAFFPPCSYLSSPRSSCPGGVEVDSPHSPDSLCGSGHASPLLGPRSRCSGASSPDCDKERGDRAEGAEATLEASLNKFSVAQNQEDSEDQRQRCSDPASSSSSSSSSSILLLNGT